MLTALLVVFLFVLMIFPHELGHFLVAKACNVQVNEFALGMGPAILKKQKGETLYSLRLVPIGGYCAMEGEDSGDETGDNPRAFNNKPWWQRILILLAGATMNVITAFLVMTAISIISGFPTNTLEAVQDGFPAAEAGIMAGDTIISIQDRDVDSWEDVSVILSEEAKEGKPLTIVVKRGYVDVEGFQVTPVMNEEGRIVIGVESHISHNFFKGIKNGFTATIDIWKSIFSSFGTIFKTENPLEQVSGPVGIVQVVNETRSYGSYFFFYLVALISINLAIINLLPLPALDGGRIVFVIIGLITGKAITDKIEGIVHTVGMVLLLMLMLFITWNDITRLLGW